MNDWNLVEQRFDQTLATLDDLDRVVAMKRAAVLGGANKASAAAILRGVDRDDEEPAGFLKAIASWRTDPESANYIKAVLGTSVATGQAIIPNNFVGGITEIASARNVWRRVLNTITGVRGKGVDIPYELTATEAAMLQGGAAQAYGSNKDVRDFSLASATATLYTIAEIVDVGNQLLRQSEGAAEQLVRRRLGKAFAKAEATFTTNGTGTNQPKGFFQSFLTYGGTGYTTALSSEPRAAALLRGMGALEARGEQATAVVMHPTDYFEMVTETLGSSGSGGWAIDPTQGIVGTPTITVGGVPIFRDPFWPAAKVGTALVGNFAECDQYFGQEYTIDVSSDAGNRFDQNLTGFRAEEEMGLNTDPFVLTGKIQQVTGL